jgi:hypothetical protein
MRLAIALLAGCGRIAFDVTPGDATGTPGDVSADAAIVPPGPAIWLRMDSFPSGGIVDSAGGHTVRCNGVCPGLTVGKHLNAFLFNGEEVVLDDRADLDTSAGFSAAIWINLISNPSGSVAAAWTKSFNAGSGYDTFNFTVQDTTGEARFDGETPAGTAVSTLGPTLSLGQWHHVAMTWDGSVRRDYFDGTQVAMTTTALGIGTNAMELGFARGAYYIHAKLDDAIYYTRALMDAEVAQLAAP